MIDTVQGRSRYQHCLADEFFARPVASRSIAKLLGGVDKEASEEPIAGYSPSTGGGDLAVPGGHYCCPGCS